MKYMYVHFNNNCNFKLTLSHIYIGNIHILVYNTLKQQQQQHTVTIVMNVVYV